MNEIITVTGKGKISLPPDTIQINISVEIIRDTYEGTMDATADAVTVCAYAKREECSDYFREREH